SSDRDLPVEPGRQRGDRKRRELPEVLAWWVHAHGEHVVPGRHGMRQRRREPLILEDGLVGTDAVPETRERALSRVRRVELEYHRHGGLAWQDGEDDVGELSAGRWRLLLVEALRQLRHGLREGPHERACCDNPRIILVHVVVDGT